MPLLQNVKLRVAATLERILNGVRSPRTQFLSVGLVIGYVLGLFRLHEILMQHILSLRVDFSISLPYVKPLIDFFDRSISTEFLSDVAAFEAAIIAFLIPLSLEMVSRISERYQSEVVLRPFEDEWENRVLLRLLLANVLVALTMRFFLDDTHITGWWKPAAWIVFLVFLLTALTIYRFIAKLKKYMTDTQFLIDKLFKDASKAVND